MTQERHASQGLPELKLHQDAHGRRRVARGAQLVAIVIVLVLLLGLGRTLLVRRSEAAVLQDRARGNAVVHVIVTRPSGGTGDTKLTLPGTLQGRVEAQIYARASGYVKHWYKDIGASVRKGELLADLDIPEVRRQVDEAMANYQLAKTAYERWSRLHEQDAVSQQELDEKTGAYRQTEAVLKRLRDELAYGQVLAPFDGIVTRRNIDVGDLINAGGVNNPPLFAMSQVNKLHVYVYIPQDRASRVHVGDSVDIAQTDRPNLPIVARVTRTAGAIDQATGTLQIDVEIDNANHVLLPGTSVQAVVHLQPSGVLTLPTNTLLFGKDGTQVAAVKDGKVQRRVVTLGTDYGLKVEVRSGITAGDDVIVNPPDSIANGQPVAVQAPGVPASGVSPRAAVG